MITNSSTLFRYISTHFLRNMLIAIVVLLGLIFVIHTIELLRRAAARPDVSFRLVVEMSALVLPQYAQRMLPFSVLFGAIYSCWKLNNTHELVVIRAAGISAWQFLSPMIATALAFGIFATTVINPVSSIFISKYNQMENTYLNAATSLVSVSRTGIWLRQPLQDDGYAILHSAAFDQKEWRLSDVSIIFFDKADNFTKRIDSPVAVLKDGYWEIQQAVTNERKGDPVHTALEKLPTELTGQKIEESFADPETISFWSLPDYIHIMEETGFPAVRLHIQLQALLAKPLLFMAMVLLAATFSLRPPRFGGAGAMIALGVAAGFFIFFMESMLNTFGISQKIPVYMAAWTPAIVSLLLGITALLHLEDG
ncbi:MAG: LPS export ABC transporter permease LptG [Micavibrio sp.]|nr:LPS export ABC transporter permease LptG [Micavibrio sp.]